jgi:guanine deaminase
MLQVAGAAAALSKVRNPDYGTWLSAREVLSAGTQGGARAFGFGNSLGVIERGALADLVAYRLDSVPFTPLHDPVRQLIYAERGADIDFAMVNGDVALRDGRFTRVDEPRLLAEIHTEIDGLAEQLAASEASVAPVRAAMDALYRRALEAEIPGDTHAARLA